MAAGMHRSSSTPPTPYPHFMPGTDLQMGCYNLLLCPLTSAPLAAEFNILKED
jgi:hypothetical protein